MTAIRTYVWALLVFGMTSSALADVETNFVLQVVKERVSVVAYADVETAYWARGAIVDKNPFSAQYGDLSFDLDPFGRLGGYAWSVSSMSGSGQSAVRRYAYNEIDYAVYYGYEAVLYDGWSLETVLAKKWVTLPGYRPHAHSISEWNVSQALKNPYVTPYYLLRRAVHGQTWCYWDVGLERGWELCDRLKLTARVFGELGDARHFRAQYGDNPNAVDGKYAHGLMALNLLLRLDYQLTDHLGFFVFVHQFDVVCADARDALDASDAPEAIKDLTIGGVGLALTF